MDCELITHEEIEKFWHLCRRARSNGKFRPFGSHPLKHKRDTGFLWYDKNRVYIILDGSSNLREHLTNLIWFTTGFQKSAKGFSVFAEGVSDQVQKICKETDVLRLGGHSRGGAGALILACILVCAGYDVEYVVTFGAPKPGGRAFYYFCKFLGIVHYRLRIVGDFVPDLPKIRGKHYQTHEVILNDQKGERKRKPLFPFSKRFLHGVKRHLSYGILLKKGVASWK